ncbi:MAG: ferric iron uptake transcriptional regulator [Gammaproteobacteria bacterium]|jgi:Fur family ferric uptake transcriptional regulator|nr:ferric iron uptake transcriptional regulator [Gammaproteobacteria bacterium]MDP6147187.1 ferric iron uptake transcriptional regulator [Gammaproteobacteria bacterium]HJL80717.1 ferric iron uptake transcriptional regulator [Gammaproteobacteria bacterium]HJM09239.1 ferric iron uptake transcriptional regulator [Gammaproteobacteria bacterium]HJN00913.1 ferric iron uptake transcriptional regulator [Gammaproteobacteria bacterium]|tara:strand:+ start:11599 stop:12006 length:408 start_codon:yes stop_codon:yes gene_type:complete
MSKNNEIKSAGLKVTHARKRILEVLETSRKSHLSADDINKILIKNNDEVGVATVYRVLNQFVDADICIKHNFDSGQAVFELTPAHHHDHMVCVKTGKVVEFEDELIEKRQEKLAKKNGYRIVDHSLVLFVEPIDD